ncbi:XRE family transcriptional regulator [Sulfurimonas sp.]|uniref:XRE family transcriptional regulator n=1 Tax=Sulfurimonas sp. TaxID=2022749 RepID=UPI0025E3F30F|nr:XRE family transcriptional regulator [Sulfurimonas sp.]
MVGKRIQRAREAESLSLRALAEIVGVSQTTISKYEKEDSTPDSTMLLKLSKALNVKTNFFFQTNEFILENKEYRKRTISNIELRSIESKILNFVEKRFEVESLFPNLPFNKFKVPALKTKQISKLKDVPLIADELREAWELGIDPISDLSNVLESNGIKVFMIDESADNNFDGLAAIVNDYHIIVISKNWPGDRQRFTLAHELGHLILEGRLCSKMDDEKASDRFAAAFLLPEKSLKNQLTARRKSIEIAELALIKEEFGVSMQAVFIRANQAGIIDYLYSNSLWKLFKKEGWDKKEPGEQYPSEKIHIFKQLVLRAVSEEYIEESKAAELLDMTVKKFLKYRMTGK